MKDKNNTDKLVTVNIKKNTEKLVTVNIKLYK